jgi:iron complex outermembrane receptor protein
MTKDRSSALALLLLIASLRTSADEPAPTQLPNITVRGTLQSDYVVPDASTGTKTDTPVMDTPLNIQTVTQQVLQDQQTIRIDQALKNVSGIAFTNGGDTSFGNAFDSAVLRGFSTDSHLRNGVRIDSSGSDTEFFTQQLANVESIEVLKGPAAILYGAVEPGGVVNVVTKKPQATFSVSAEQQFGSYGLYRTTLDTTGPLNSAATVLYRVDASYNTSGSILNLGFKRDLFVAPTLKLLIGSRAQVTLEYEHKDSGFNGNYAIFPLIESPSGQFVPLFNDSHLNFGERSRVQELADLGALDWSLRLGEGWSVRQQILANIVHATGPQVTTFGLGPINPSDPASTPAVYRVEDPFDTRDDTYASNLDLTGKFSTGSIMHTLLVGGDWYRFNSRFVLSASNPSFVPDPAVDSLISLFNPVHPGTPFGSSQPFAAGTGPTRSWGAHLQDQLSLADTFFVLAGVRYQHVFETNDTGPTLSSLTSSPLNASASTPRIGILWRPWQWVSAYVNYAKNWGPSNGFPDANGGLVPPTNANQKEVGIKFELLGGRVSSTFALYDLTKTNIPTADPANPNVFLVTGKVRSRGLEFDLQGEVLSGWNVIVNFSDIDARITSSNDPANPPGTQWQQTPRLIGNLWTTYEVAPKSDHSLKFGVGINAQGSQPALDYTGVPATQATDYTRIAGYATTNAMAAYRLTVNGVRLLAQLNVSNLIDRRYFSYISLNNPQPYSTYTYGNGVYGFDRRLYGDPRAIVGSISVQL